MVLPKRSMVSLTRLMMPPAFFMVVFEIRQGMSDVMTSTCSRMFLPLMLHGMEYIPRLGLTSDPPNLNVALLANFLLDELPGLLGELLHEVNEPFPSAHRSDTACVKENVGDGVLVVKDLVDQYLVDMDAGEVCGETIILAACTLLFLENLVVVGVVDLVALVVVWLWGQSLAKCL